MRGEVQGMVCAQEMLRCWLISALESGMTFYKKADKAYFQAREQGDRHRGRACNSISDN
jgi:hypothetical protein